MKINEVTEAGFDMDPKTKMLVDFGRKLMDISASTPMKGLKDEEIAKTNRMSAFGDELTRLGTPMGPRNMEEVLAKSGVKPQEAKEFIDMAVKAAPAKIKGDDVEDAVDDTEDDFGAPDDD